MALLLLLFLDKNNDLIRINNYIEYEIDFFLQVTKWRRRSLLSFLLWQKRKQERPAKLDSWRRQGTGFSIVFFPYFLFCFSLSLSIGLQFSLSLSQKYINASKRNCHCVFGFFFFSLRWYIEDRSYSQKKAVLSFLINICSGSKGQSSISAPFSLLCSAVYIYLYMMSFCSECVASGQQ